MYALFSLESRSDFGTCLIYHYWAGRTSNVYQHSGYTRDDLLGICISQKGKTLFLGRVDMFAAMADSGSKGTSMQVFFVSSIFDNVGDKIDCFRVYLCCLSIASVVSSIECCGLSFIDFCVENSCGKLMERL